MCRHCGALQSDTSLCSATHGESTCNNNRREASLYQWLISRGKLCIDIAPVFGETLQTQGPTYTCWTKNHRWDSDAEVKWAHLKTSPMSI